MSLQALTLHTLPFHDQTDEPVDHEAPRHKGAAPAQQITVSIMAAPNTAATNHEQNRCQALMITASELANSVWRRGQLLGQNRAEKWKFPITAIRLAIDHRLFLSRSDQDQKLPEVQAVKCAIRRLQCQGTSCEAAEPLHGRLTRSQPASTSASPLGVDQGAATGFTIPTSIESTQAG